MGAVIKPKTIFSFLMVYLLVCVKARFYCVFYCLYSMVIGEQKCCHVANDFTNFKGNRRTNEQTNIWTAPSRKAPAVRAGA